MTKGKLCTVLTRSVLAPGLWSLALSLGVSAQTLDPDPGIEYECWPEQDGQWAGPFNLEAEINVQPDEWNEIAHGTLLPPPNGGLVMLWCERNLDDCQEPGFTFTPYETFVWDPERPSNPLVKFITDSVAAGGAYGEDDLFCGAQTLDPDGRPISFGGTDGVLACGEPGPVGEPDDGHTKVWIFDNAPLGEAAWHRASAGPSGTGEMAWRRWYPSPVRRADGRVSVVGHTIPNPIILGSANNTRETGRVVESPTLDFDFDTEQGSEDFFNYGDGSTGACELDDGSGFKGYPKLHLLRDTSIFSSHGYDRFSPYGSQGSVFLDLDACQEPENERWLPMGTPQPEPMPYRGKTIHFVDETFKNGIGEVIYAIGGDTNHPQGDCNVDITTQVLRMVNPGPAAVWTTAGAPQLQRPRKYADPVVLLDGSILILDGFGPLPDQTGCQEPVCCGYYHRPERLKPAEVFETPGAWDLMCPNTSRRAHHSVAGLLPDGRVYSAGGDESAAAGMPTPVNGDNYSVTIFSPPYVFARPRPVIESVSLSDWAAGSPAPITIQATMEGGDSGEFRVALLAPGAMTHSTDFNQRYIKLFVLSASFSAPPAMSTIEVLPPISNGVAPPGWYMLAVVNSVGVPSGAVWIKVMPQGP